MTYKQLMSNMILQVL